MANTIASQTIVNGPKALVVKITIVGDGSGEETGTVIVDASTFPPIATENKLRKIEYLLSGFSAYLSWDGSVDTQMTSLAEDHPYFMQYDFCEESMEIGGLPNNATSPTGDVLITTSGLGLGDHGFIILYLAKKNPPFIL